LLSKADRRNNYAQFTNMSPNVFVFEFAMRISKNASTWTTAAKLMRFV